MTLNGMLLDVSVASGFNILTRYIALDDEMSKKKNFKNFLKPLISQNMEAYSVSVDSVWFV